MTYRHLQKRLREARKLEDTITLANQIWLAGLGALARAQQEGPAYFDQLVQCGEIMETIEKMTVCATSSNWLDGSLRTSITTGPLRPPRRKFAAWPRRSRISTCT